MRTWPFHIADPLEPSNDLGRSCAMEVFQRMQGVLTKNHELLRVALLTATGAAESKSLIEALFVGVVNAYHLGGVVVRTNILFYVY